MDNSPQKKEDAFLEKVSGGLTASYTSNTDSHDKYINAPITTEGNGNVQIITGGVNFNQGDSNSKIGSSSGVDQSTLDLINLFKDW